MNSSHHHHHHDHHDVHQQRLLWFFSFCNQRSSSSSTSSTGSNGVSSRRNNNGSSNRRKSSGSSSSRNKFALQYQQKLLQQQKQSSNVFGRDITEHTMLYNNPDDNDFIPHIVKSCSKFIEKHGIIFGIYRLSGMRVNIHKLRQDFDKNPKISSIDSETISNDAHAVACVLKQYFRELPTPLLTFHMYEKFIELFKHSNTTTNLVTTTTTSAQITSTSSNNSNNDNDNQKSMINLAESSVNAKKTCQASSGSITSSSGQHFDRHQTSLATSMEHDMNDLSKCNHTSSNDVTRRTEIEIDRQSLKSAKCAGQSSTSGPNTSSLARTDSQDQQAQEHQNSKLIDEMVTSTTIAQPHDKEPSSKSQALATSSSDSQLVSLSSIVATTASDVKYQVRLDELRRLLLKLPKAHYQTLKFLMHHLALIAANGHKTGMDSKNVAIVWAPNLLKPSELELSAGLETLQVIGLQAVITEQLIKHHKFLFNDTDGTNMDFRPNSEG